MAVSDPNKFASVGNVKALFETGEGFVHSANIDPDYSLVPLTGSTGQVLTAGAEGGLEWKSIEPQLLWSGDAVSGSVTAEGLGDYTALMVEAGYSGSSTNLFSMFCLVDQNGIVSGGTTFSVKVNAEGTVSTAVPRNGLFRASLSGDTMTGKVGNSGSFFLSAYGTQQTNYNSHHLINVWGLS